MGGIPRPLANAGNVRSRAAAGGAPRMAGSRLPASRSSAARHRQIRRRRRLARHVRRACEHSPASARTPRGRCGSWRSERRPFLLRTSTSPGSRPGLRSASEPGEVGHAAIEEQLAAGRPRGMSARSFTYALFDTGALHCRARPRCQGCPLAATCASRNRLVAASPVPRPHSPRYHGSTRELRGAVLRAMLGDPRPRTIDELRTRAGPPAAGLLSTDIALVLDTLVHEGLVDPTPRMVRIN